MILASKRKRYMHHKTKSTLKNTGETIVANSVSLLFVCQLGETIVANSVSLLFVCQLGETIVAKC